MNRLFENIRKGVRAAALLQLVCLMPMLYACVNELEPGGSPSAAQEGEAWVTLDFGADVMPVISTKASAETENQLFNFFLFMFDMDNGGKQVYGRMFDTDNRRTSATFDSSADECWYVEYTHTANGVTYPGGGKVKVKAPLGGNFNIYMIGNLDADMIRISSDLLNHIINSEADLRNFEVVMNQEVVSRNGYFPMSGSIREIEVVRGDDGKGHFNIKGTGRDAILELLRFDAKIEFDFKFNKDNITSFEAKQWQVVNVPKTAYVLSYDERGFGNDEVTGQDSGNVPVPPDGTDLGTYYSQYAGKFFDTDPVNFEEVNSEGVSSFTFYMLPNRMTPKKPLSEWNIQDASLGAWCERDRQHKLANDKNQMADVSYTTTTRDAASKRMRIFENVNDFSTYVVVTGRVDMVLKEGEQAGQVLGADVQYLIHLGDWTGGKYDNFNVRRNTNYKYTVTINNVDNIRVEVESSRDGEEFKENQPGAIGEVVIAKEEIAVCDCHYTTKTMTFHLSNFYSNGNNIANELIWTVDTPFIDDDIVQDGGVPNFPDYEWAHFRLNKRVNEKADGTFTYLDNKRKYTTRKWAESTTYRTASENTEDDGSGADGVAGFHNDGIMDIITLVDYIKRQVALYEQWDKYGGVNTSDFDYSYTDGKRDPVIKMTLFVDEYYYERDPVTHEYDPMLWKKFVNTKDRTMNILCDSNVSKDGESRVTGSVITIQQHSIQTIYDNDNPNLRTAWGLELEDEYGNELEWKIASSTDGNTDEDNGLLNTVRLWGLCGSGNYNYIQGVRWDSYVNFEVKNDIPILIDDGTHKDLRYSCLARNRDNNGNGIIDREEVRWYIASIQQLVGIYVGDPVLSKSVRLYNRSAAEMGSPNKSDWMQHIVSSTKFDAPSWNLDQGNYPTLVWAEEGISTGTARAGDQEGASANSLRCVRNLGYLGNASDESYPLDEIPQNFGNYVDAKDSDTGNAYFDSEFLNKACFRYETSRELEYHHNNSVENRLVRRFELADESISIPAPRSMTFKDLNDAVNDDMRTSGENSYCPDGYRLPNQRELVVLRYFTTLSLPVMMTRTYWIFGSTEEAEKGGYSKHGIYSGDKYGFSLNGNLSVSNANSIASGNAIRCVRDVHVD